MRDPTDVAALGGLIRRRGTPKQPQAIEQVSEVRSDCFLSLPPLTPDQTTAMMSAVNIQWRYAVPYSRVAEFHKFLADNERVITEGCETTLSGVHYRGTYLRLFGARSAYATFWHYDTFDCQKEWQKVLTNKRSNFYRAVRTLRSYWTDDPNSWQEHLGAAAGIDLNQGFFAITLDAASGAPEPPAPRRPAARKKG